MIISRRKHRAPWECTFVKEDKSKCELGICPESDREYFEILCLCILQAGLGWGMIRKNRSKFRRGFYGFNIQRLEKPKKDELLNRDGVIKNRMKVEGIINNAKKFRNIKQDKGSFSNLLKSLKGMEDQEVIKILTQTFAHMGNYTGEYYLHSVGHWD